jgi:hypothetical protein
MADEKQPDLTLSDGRAITFDLNKMTVKEWRAFIDEITVDTEDELMERCAGVETGTIAALGYEDWRLFAKAFYKRVREASDPN